MPERPIQGILGGRSLVSITPDDSNDLATVTRGLYVGAAGDVSIILEDDESAVLLTALSAGVVHPLRAKRVRATGTTATGIVGVL